MPGKHWTKERFDRTLRAAYKEGCDLRVGPVQLSPYRSLYRVHRKFYDDWRGVLSVNGIDYDEFNQRKKEREKQKFLADLRTAYEKGVPLDATSLVRNKANRHLYYKRDRFYEGPLSWENALSEAGLPPGDIVRQRAYDRERIKREILRRYAEEKPLNSGAVSQDRTERGLYRAVVDHFDSWDEMLKYVGLDPSKIRKQRKEYSRAEIIGEIIALKIKGENLSGSRLKKRKGKLRRLVWAAEKMFDGDWPKAVETAGINYSQYRIRHGRWNRQQVIDAINQRHSEGKPLNAASVSSSLYHAAKRYAGSWPEAIEAAGLNYDEIRLDGKSLTENEIISRIVERHTEGKPLNVASVQNDPEFRPVYYQANQKFTEGWRGAVRSAGFDYSEIRLKRHPYTLEELGEIVRELEKRGVSLRATDIQRDPANRRYNGAVLERFDSWYDFLDAVGIDSSKYLSHRDWAGGDGIVAYLQERYEAGIVTGASSDKAFAAAAQKYLGTVRNAVETAGLVYSKNGKITRQMLEQRPEIIGTLYKHNEGFLRGIANRVYWGAVNRGMRTLDIDDLMSEAFSLFLGLLPRKPAKVGLRQYTYKSIFYGLIRFNRKHFREVYMDGALLDTMEVVEEE